MTGLAAAAPLVLTMTDARTGCAHLVTDDAATAGRRAGCYVAVSGWRGRRGESDHDGAWPLPGLR
ncbi:MAG: hypothetical protein ACRDRM_12700 [Pseudonocardiaceae bacterium]